MITAWAKILFVVLLNQGTVMNVQMCQVSDYKDPAFMWVNLDQNTASVSIGHTCVICDGSDFQAPQGQ